MYLQDMTWNDWKSLVESLGAQIDSALMRGEDEFTKWYKLTYGKTDAEIKALFDPELTDQQLNDLKYALGVLNELYYAYNNVMDVVKADRRGYLLPFLY